ncbi:MAG: ATP-grasp domain-containing protein [Granulosicoccus sp.]
MANVLLTCVGRRNYLANYFRQALAGQGKVIGTDMNPTAPGLVDCDEQCVVSNVYAENYIDQLTDLCVEKQVSLLISLNDLELPILSSAKERFEQHGVIVAISHSRVIDICSDKLATYHWLQENNFPTPDTYAELDAALAAVNAGALQFPCIVKPRWGSGSIGIFTVHDEKELKAAYTLVLSQVIRGMLFTVSRADLPHSVLIQARCGGTEFGCDILNDFTAITRGVVTKQKLAMRAGETDKAVVRKNDKLSVFCQSLGQRLGHIGNLDCDIFVDGDTFHVLELNARFGGGYPFSHVAGAQFPQALLAWSKAEHFQPTALSLTYDVPYSKFDTLGRVDNVATQPSVTDVREILRQGAGN